MNTYKLRETITQQQKINAAIKKVHAVIESCTLPEHLEAADRMICNFINVHCRDKKKVYNEACVAAAEEMIKAIRRKYLERNVIYTETIAI